MSASEPVPYVTTRGETRWRWRITVTPVGATRPVQKRGTAETYDQAKADAAEARRLLRNTGALTVQELCDRWLSARRREVGTPGGIQQKTLDGYASSVSALMATIGSLRATQLTHSQVSDGILHVTTWGGAWQRGLSKRSVGYALGTLRQIFDFGIEKGWVSENPVIVPSDRAGAVVWVYLIRCKANGFVKIGKSTDPERRLRSLTLLSPTNDLELLAAWPETILSEYDCHARFSDERQHGEWFFGPRIEQFIHDQT